MISSSSDESSEEDDPKISIHSIVGIFDLEVFCFFLVFLDFFVFGLDLPAGFFLVDLALHGDIQPSSSAIASGEFFDAVLFFFDRIGRCNSTRGLREFIKP